MFFALDPYPIQRAIQEQAIGFIPDPQQVPAPDEWMRRLGELPLMAQPGERWFYNIGYDILGVLVARAAGQDLETFMRERLFGPLGMNDTGFSVPAEKRARLAAFYFSDPQSGALTLFDEASDSRQKSVEPLVPGYWESHGWGFGGSVVTRRVSVSDVPGKYGWDGGFGTSWYVDPAEEMVTIVLTQAAFTSANPPAIVRDFWTGAYQAIDD